MLKLENSIRGLSFSRVAFDLTIQVVKKQSLIDELSEYKQSLIYEVVTGKKEVPHV